jgi:hypothetical protein
MLEHNPIIEYQCGERNWKALAGALPTSQGLVSGKLAFFRWSDFRKYHGGGGGLPRHSLFEVRIDTNLSSPDEKNIAVLRDFRLNPGAAMSSPHESTGIINIKGADWDIEYSWRGIEYLSFMVMISVRREER